MAALPSWKVAIRHESTRLAKARAMCRLAADAHID